MLHEIDFSVERNQATQFGLTIEQGVEFNKRTNCVTFALLKEMDQIVIGDFKKIAILATNRTRKLEIEDMIDVVILRKNFNFHSYWQCRNKKHKGLLHIYKCLNEYFEQIGLDTRDLRAAYERLAKQFKQHKSSLLYSVDRKTSRNRAMIAWAQFEYDELQVDFHVSVETIATGSVTHLRFASTDNTYWSNFNHLTTGKLRWIDSQTLDFRTAKKVVVGPKRWVFRVSQVGKVSRRSGPRNAWG